MASQPIFDPDRYIDDSEYECIDGRLRQREVPGRRHGKLARHVESLLLPFANTLGGDVVSEWSISDGAGGWLTPDVTFSYPEFKGTRRDHLVAPAYLVVEIRSIDQPLRELFDKRELYRRLAIPHYWLIDPIEQACYECLQEIRLCNETLTTDRIEIPVSQIFG